MQQLACKDTTIFAYVQIKTFFFCICQKNAVPLCRIMDTKKLYRIIEWSVAVVACGWLGWKLATYDDYASLWTTLRVMDAGRWLAIGLSVALMPVNMSLEAWRWRTLVPMSWREAHRQVYYSKLAGLITPWRLGEYPARALLQGEWTNTLSMGAVGSATMTAAIILAGIIGLVGEIGLIGEIGIDSPGYYMLIGGILLLLAVGLYWAPRLLRRWAEVSHRLVAISLGQSFLRLVCWCVQLAFVLYALDGLGSLGGLGILGKTAVYYLLVTITPNVPVAEIGVRGAWAIGVFGSMNAAFAGILLWVINTLLPCLIWPILRKK